MKFLSSVAFLSLFTFELFLFHLVVNWWPSWWLIFKTSEAWKTATSASTNKCLIHQTLIRVPAPHLQPFYVDSSSLCLCGSTVESVDCLLTLLSMRSQTILLLKYSIWLHLIPSCTYSSYKVTHEFPPGSTSRTQTEDMKQRERRERSPALPSASTRWRSAAVSRWQSWCRTVQTHFSEEETAHLITSHRVIRRISSRLSHWGFWWCSTYCCVIV